MFWRLRERQVYIQNLYINLMSDTLKIIFAFLWKTSCCVYNNRTIDTPLQVGVKIVASLYSKSLIESDVDRSMKFKRQSDCISMWIVSEYISRSSDVVVRMKSCSWTNSLQSSSSVHVSSRLYILFINTSSYNGMSCWELTSMIVYLIFIFTIIKLLYTLLMFMFVIIN